MVRERMTRSETDVDNTPASSSSCPDVRRSKGKLLLFVSLPLCLGVMFVDLVCSASESLPLLTPELSFFYLPM